MGKDDEVLVVALSSFLAQQSLDEGEESLKSSVIAGVLVYEFAAVQIETQSRKSLVDGGNLMLKIFRHGL